MEKKNTPKYIINNLIRYILEFYGNSFKFSN